MKIGSVAGWNWTYVKFEIFTFNYRYEVKRKNDAVRSKELGLNFYLR
jgi:hypothetical protein